MSVYKSYFNAVSANPPVLSLSFINPSGQHKDTCANILESKEFTVNIISEPFIEAANWTAVNAPTEVDEWIGSGLTKEPSVRVHICVAFLLRLIDTTLLSKFGHL